MHMRERGGNHCFVGALPVPRAAGAAAEATLCDAAKAAGFEFEVRPRRVNPLVPAPQSLQRTRACLSHTAGAAGDGDVGGAAAQHRRARGAARARGGHAAVRQRTGTHHQGQGPPCGFHAQGD